MEDENKMVVEREEYSLTQFIIDTIKDNPLAFACGVVGLCVGIILDEKRRNNKEME